MQENISLVKLEENLTWLRKMYDIVRLVDPVEKKVLEYGNYKFLDTKNICHDYWQNNKICDNCISTRAYLGNKSFIKLEQSPDAIMVVTAVPVNGSKKPLVVELLKNATDSMVLGRGEYSKGQPIQNIVTGLNDLIVKDELSGLYNRRYVDERLPADVIRTTLEDNRLSVIFTDIDNLKEINDDFGHVYGDRFICEISNIISRALPKSKDWAARYGGDEFLICLNDIGIEKAYVLADDIRNQIKNFNLKINGKTASATASMGVYSINSCSKLSAEEIIALADNRMYHAKKLGKNCVVAFDKNIPPSE